MVSAIAARNAIRLPRRRLAWQPRSSQRKDPFVIQPTRTLPTTVERKPRSWPRSRRVIRRRRVFQALGLIGLLAIVVLGVQGWRIVSAIVRAEHAAVVPLPTRVSTAAFGSAPQATPTQAAPAKSSASPSSAGVIVAAATPAAAAQSAPTATPAPMPATATAAVQTQSSGGGPSALDVLRQVAAAGVDTSDPGLSPTWQGKTDLTILVAGVDRRTDGGDQNADVIIIAHIDLIHKRVAAVSIPRDLLVAVPGVGPDKINGAYNAGVKNRPNDPAAGVGKLRDTIETNFGVPIDGYVLLDFAGFQRVVNAMGGIDVTVPYAIHDDQYPTENYGTEVVDFQAGRQHMNGDRALKYVRTRHADSDDARRDRQMQVLLALFDKGKRFTSLARADKIILALGNSVQTSFGLDQQLLLAHIAYQMQRPDIRLSTLTQPLIQGGTTDDGRWVYTGDHDAIVAFINNALVPAPQPANQPGQ